MIEYYRNISDWTVTDFLDQLTADDLRKIVKWLKIPNPKPTRKDDMRAAVRSRMTPDFLRKVWPTLSNLEQLAVSEALHINPDRELNLIQFRAKYGKLPFDPSTFSVRLPLGFFLFYTSRHWNAEIILPKDLSNQLLSFVPPPAPYEVKSVNQLPDSVTRKVPTYDSHSNETVEAQLTRRETEYAAGQDLHTVLRLVNLGQISVGASTGRPTAASMKRINAKLFEGDYFEPEVKNNRWDQVVVPIKPFAWPMLLIAGKFVRKQKSKLVLTKSGKAALLNPVAESLAFLWQAWSENNILDEFNRVDTIKGQFRGKGKRSMTSPAERRFEIDMALCYCPVGQWIRITDFSRMMQALGHSFEVCLNPWNLYIGEQHYGSLGYSGYHGWNILQGRYIQCLFFEYLATLGMIDIAYTHPRDASSDFLDLWGADELSWLSQYDGLEYFRLTALGVYCLGLEEEYEPPVMAVKSGLTVLPNLVVQAHHSLSTAERLTLETYADEESDNTWRLAVNKIALAVENGQSVDSLRDFLTERDDQLLPETVEGMLRKIEQNAGALKMRGEAKLIECISKEVATEISTNPHASKLCHLAGAKQLVVRTRNEKAFRKAINALGYSLPLT